MCFRHNGRALLGALLKYACGFSLLCCPSAHADVASSVRKLGPWAKGLKIGPGMDASGRILKGCEFVGLDLRNANFDGAHLGGCRFFQCDLRDASFKNAVFAGLFWDECNIEGADFTDAAINDVRQKGRGRIIDVSFTAAQFMSTRSYKTKKLSNCEIRIAPVNDKAIPYRFDFRGADLRGTVFRYTDLRKSDFTDARISRADFSYCWITGEQLTSSFGFKSSRDLNRVHLGGVDGPVDLSDSDLVGSLNIPSHANITGAIIADCTLRSPVSPEQLQSTKSYQEGRLTGITYYNQNLSGVDLSAQNLSGSSFSDCNLVDTKFDDAVISNTTFTQFRKKDSGLTIDQIKATWNYKHRRMSGITLPEHIAKALRQEQQAEK